MSPGVVVLASLPTVLVSALALWYRHYYWKRSSSNGGKPPSPRSKILFFPDEATARSLSSNSKNGSVELGSLALLMSTLQKARKSIDVCVFMITCKELTDILISAHQRSVIVRIITDNENVFTSGSQIEVLRRAGVQVRTDNASYLMHHKFAVIDEEVLVNGSLNWTLQGVCGNQENIIITDSVEMVTPFLKKFESLWDVYDPGKLHDY